MNGGGNSEHTSNDTFMINGNGGGVMMNGNGTTATARLSSAVPPKPPTRQSKIYYGQPQQAVAATPPQQQTAAQVFGFAFFCVRMPSIARPVGIFFRGKGILSMLRKIGSTGVTHHLWQYQNSFIPFLECIHKLENGPGEPGAAFYWARQTGPMLFGKIRFWRSRAQKPGASYWIYNSQDVFRYFFDFLL